MTDRRRSDGRSPASAAPSKREEPPRADGSSPLRIPSPAWLPTDDVIGPRADRQVLVVGTTPAGLTLTRLLGAAGYEPVLVSGADPPVTSRVTYISPAALEVLGSLDVGAALHDRGRAIAGATVRRTDDPESNGTVDVATSGAPDPGRAPPVVVPTPILLRTLRDAVPAAATVQDRAVDSISRGTEGIRVTFDDGVRESFDVVVDVGGRSEPLRPDERDADGEFRRYETVVDADAGTRRVRDVWGPDAVVQRLPGVGGEEFVRVAVPADGAAGRDARHALPDRQWVPDAGVFERRRMLHRRLPGGEPPRWWWGNGRVAYCGPAARPAAPAAGVGESLGITDALGLVSALTRDVGARAAVDAYAAGRARRLDELQRTVTRDGAAVSTPRATDHPLGSIRVLRAIALEPFFGTAPGPLGPGDHR